MFKVVSENLNQAKDGVEQFGAVWVHGDGNLYHDEKASEFRRDYSNPDDKAAKHRVKFTAVSQIPDSVEEFHKMLVASRNKEDQASAEKQNRPTNAPTVLVAKHSAKVADTTVSVVDDAPKGPSLVELEAIHKSLDDRDTFLTNRAEDLREAKTKLESEKSTLLTKEQELKAREDRLAAIEKDLNAKAEALNKGKGTPGK